MALGKTTYTFIKTTIPVVAEELGSTGYNTAMSEERNKGAFVMSAEAADINTLWSAMILNDEVAANAILKRATRHYTVVIKPTSTD